MSRAAHRYVGVVKAELLLRALLLALMGSGQQAEPWATWRPLATAGNHRLATWRLATLLATAGDYTRVRAEAVGSRV